MIVGLYRGTHSRQKSMAILNKAKIIEAHWMSENGFWLCTRFGKTVGVQFDWAFTEKFGRYNLSHPAIHEQFHDGCLTMFSICNMHPEALDDMVCASWTVLRYVISDSMSGNRFCWDSRWIFPCHTKHDGLTESFPKTCNVCSLEYMRASKENKILVAVKPFPEPFGMKGATLYRERLAGTLHGRYSRSSYGLEWKYSKPSELTEKCKC